MASFAAELEVSQNEPYSVEGGACNVAETMATKEAQDEEVCATAHFSTYEDLSSRLFLIPFNDDDCRGAQVCSHEVFIESPHCIQAQQQKESTPVQETDGSASDSKETESVSNSTTNAGSATETVDEASDSNGKSAADDSDASKPTGNKKKGKKKKKKKQQQVQQPHEMNATDAVKVSDSSVNNVDAEKDVAADGSGENGESQPNSCDNVETFEHPIPSGHVLVKLMGKIACTEHTVDQLDEMDFNDILLLLRDVAYTISLTFTSPEHVIKEKDENETTSCVLV